MKPSRVPVAVPALILLLCVGGLVWFVVATETRRAAQERVDYRNHVRSLVAWLPEGCDALDARAAECRAATERRDTRQVDLLAELALRGNAARRDLDELVRRADNLAPPAGLDGVHAGLRESLLLVRSAETELLDYLARRDPGRLAAAVRSTGAARELARRLRSDVP